MRRTTKARHRPSEPGQDSFLDIVANLVGILIILVMIVGAQAKDAMLQADVTPDGVDQQAVEEQKNALADVGHDLQALLDRAEKQQVEIAYRRSERDRILTLITTIEQDLEKQRGDLSHEAQQALELQRQIADARRAEENLKLSREAVERSTAPVQVVMHRPTPLAKTVFGREVHFQMQGGRVVYVPLEELVEEFKTEAKQKTWKLRQAPSITETVGPIRDFRLKYTLKRETHNIETRAGTAYQERIELDHFVLVPVRDNLGETLDVALQPQSQFRSLLGSFNPNDATVTVWVYPDSFDQYRQLKEELFKLGFLTASRPMPEGQPISGSPNGTRSAVQ